MSEVLSSIERAKGDEEVRRLFLTFFPPSSFLLLLANTSNLSLILPGTTSDLIGDHNSPTNPVLPYTVTRKYSSNNRSNGRNSNRCTRNR